MAAETDLSNLLRTLEDYRANPYGDSIPDSFYAQFSPIDQKYIREAEAIEAAEAAALAADGLADESITFEDCNLDETIREIELLLTDMETDRFTKDAVDKVIAPQNWWDKLPDFQPQVYLAILKEQSSACARYLFSGLPDMDNVEAHLDAFKYPYREKLAETLTKTLSTPSIYSEVQGKELKEAWIESKDNITGRSNLKELVGKISPVHATNATTQVKVLDKYKPLEPPWIKGETVRDDITDQVVPAIEMLDLENVVREFVNIEETIFDQETENPYVFGSQVAISQLEKDKNVVLANWEAYKVNVQKMQHIDNIVEDNSAYYLTQKVNAQKKITKDCIELPVRTRALRETLVSWYDSKEDPDTKTWPDYHWEPGQVGHHVGLLTAGEYIWYDNLVAGLENSLARLDDIEAFIDTVDSLSNVLGMIAQYVNAVELGEIEMETSLPMETKVATIKTYIDSSMRDLLVIMPIIATIAGALTPLRATLQATRAENLAILSVVRTMSPTTMDFPTLWSQLEILTADIIADIDMHLNILITDALVDHENEGWHCSVNHTALDITSQLNSINSWIVSSVTEVIETQVKLPKIGLERLDSMLNKVNEMRLWGPLCNLPDHYRAAIDNVNVSCELLNGIWSEVFDCWEREFITRVWRIVHEHHHDIVDQCHYVVPLFTAYCVPRHPIELHQPVCVAYRLGPIAHLSANFRKHVFCWREWLTSVIYALGVKHVAIANVINDPTLNGNDKNVPWLAKLNALRAHNVTLKNEIERITALYSDPGALVDKKQIDENLAVHELQPNQYSNEAMLNMSSTIPDSYLMEAKKILTNDNKAELVIPDINIGDPTLATKSVYLGAVAELSPWHHLSLFSTQRALEKVPIVVPPPPVETTIEDISKTAEVKPILVSELMP